MFNGYMLEKLLSNRLFFFTYVMYITARVNHLHENGRLSERDKPKASSRELDAVFGIPSRGAPPPPTTPTASAELAPCIMHLFSK